MNPFAKIPVSYRRLLEFTKPYKGRLAAGILFGILYGPTNVAVLGVVKRVWAEFFEQNTTDHTWLQVLGVAVLLPVTMAARGICDCLNAYLMNWVGLKAVMDLRIKMFEHLHRLSLDYYSATRTGELMSRVTNDTTVVQQGIANVIEDF